MKRYFPPGNSRLSKYIKECSVISNPEDLERFMFKIFEDCRNYLMREMGIVPSDCKVKIIYKLEEYSELKKDYEKRSGQQVSDMAFIDHSKKAILGYDIIYINFRNHFENKPIKCSICDLSVSYIEELIHSSDSRKSETETVKLTFSAFKGFLGKELPEEIKQEALKQAKLRDQIDSARFV